MRVFYLNHEFELQVDPGRSIAGRLVLDEAKRTLLVRLMSEEDEDWGVGRDGERLPEDELFALSPWSMEGPEGRAKLLCRFLNLKDGSVSFQTADTYSGDVFRWIRQGGE